VHTYVNIHTHQASQDNSVFLLNNRFAFDKELFTEKFFSIGIHPWDVHVINNKLPDFEHLVQHPNCLAIGECGLDKVCKSDYRQQRYYLTEQLQLALKYQKPVIIHCVKAYDDVIGICKPYLSKIPVIMHGFNKTDELAKQLINKGFYLSVSLPFLSKHNKINLPVEKLFFETDDKKELSISTVYKLASQKLSLDETVLQEKIYSNFAALFKK